MLQFPAWKMTLVVVICLIGAIYATPNFLKTEINESWPNFAPGKRVSLGLDLQGGSYLLLEIDNQPIISQTLQNKLIELKKFQQKLGKSYEKQGLVILNLVQLKPAFQLKSERRKTFVNQRTY